MNTEPTITLAAVAQPRLVMLFKIYEPQTTTKMKKYTVTYLTPESNYATQGKMTVDAKSEKDAANIVCERAGIRQLSIAFVRPA